MDDRLSGKYIQQILILWHSKYFFDTWFYSASHLSLSTDEANLDRHTPQW